MTDALGQIARRTLAHYESRAKAFWEGTRDHDVTQNLDALLAALPERNGLRILDLGCGPGRDLVAMRALGHAPVGLDGCSAFVRMAREHSGCEVWQQSLFELALPADRFDGIFANASLFHVPRAILPRVLHELCATLVPEGALFCSNPRAFSDDHEGWQGERYGTYLTLETWYELFETAGFAPVQHFLRPAGRPEGVSASPVDLPPQLATARTIASGHVCHPGRASPVQDMGIVSILSSKSQSAKRRSQPSIHARGLVAEPAPKGES